MAHLVVATQHGATKPQTRSMERTRLNSTQCLAGVCCAKEAADKLSCQTARRPLKLGNLHLETRPPGTEVKSTDLAQSALKRAQEDF